MWAPPGRHRRVPVSRWRATARPSREGHRARGPGGTLVSTSPRWHAPRRSRRTWMWRQSLRQPRSTTAGFAASPWPAPFGPIARLPASPRPPMQRGSRARGRGGRCRADRGPGRRSRDRPGPATGGRRSRSPARLVLAPSTIGTAPNRRPRPPRAAPPRPRPMPSTDREREARSNRHFSPLLNHPSKPTPLFHIDLLFSASYI